MIYSNSPAWMGQAYLSTSLSVKGAFPRASVLMDCRLDTILVAEVTEDERSNLSESRRIV